MSTTENEFTPQKVVDQECMFTIPIYQRLFAWKEAQVVKLLEDMKECFDNSGSHYYIGMLTYVIDEKGKYVLIDGQQRMTVLVLLAIVFGWRDFFDNGNRVHFDARDEDTAYIKNRFEKETVTTAHINQDMENAIGAVKLFLRNNFPVGKEDKRKEYIDNIYTRLTFFLSKLPDSYKENPPLLNKYFEVMNSQGKALEQHEILKSRLISWYKEKQDTFSKKECLSIWNLVSQMERTIIQSVAEDSEYDLADRYCQAIDACLKKDYPHALGLCKNKKKEDDLISTDHIDVIKSGEMKENEPDQGLENDAIISFPQFLLLVLDVSRKCVEKTFSYNTDKLLTAFETFCKVDKEVLELFYQNLLLYRLLLDYYVIRREFEGGEVKEYSLIVRNEKEGNDDDYEERDAVKKLSQYQSMLYVSTDAFYNWLKPYLGVVKDNPKISVEDLLKKLKEIDKEKVAGHKKDDYIKTKSNFTFKNFGNYWFRRLDYYLWEKRQDWYKQCKKDQQEAVDKYVFRNYNSVEHFHPQDQSQQGEVDQWSVENINSFGNLALISTPFNSEQSNNFMGMKMERINRQIALKKIQSLKLLRMYIDAGNDGWTEEKAKQHQKEMLEILEESYKEC